MNAEEVDAYVQARELELDAGKVALPGDEREHIVGLLRQVGAITKPVAVVGAMARLSQDRQDGAGNARQMTDVLQLAVKEQLFVAELFIDTDRSASRFATRRRERYDVALARLLAGELSGLVGWNLDRMWRRPREAEQVFERVLDGRARIWSCQGISLTSPDTILQARILVTVAANESEATSRRTRRAMETTVSRGVAHGGIVPFGRTRALVNGKKRGEWGIEEAEAKILRDIVAYLLEGGSISAVAARLNECGIPTRRDKLWRPTTVRKMVLSASTAGLRSWQPGNVVDGRRVNVGPSTVRTAPALKPIIPVETWQQVVALLTDPVRQMSGPRGGHERRYLSPGFLVCGECDGPVSSAPPAREGAQATYRCRKSGCGKVRRNVDRVDEFLTAVTLARLAALGDEPSELLGAAAAARGELERVQLERAELTKLLVSGRLSAVGFAAAEAGMSEREAQLHTTLLASAGQKRRRRPRTEGELTTVWAAADLAGRRELIDAAGIEVVIAQVGKGRRKDRYAGMTVRSRSRT